MSLFVPPQVQLQRQSWVGFVYSMSVFRIPGGFLHYIWIYACVLISKRKPIFRFILIFFFFFPAGLFKLIWKQSLEYFCVSFAGSKYSASVAFFFWRCLSRWTDLWQIPLHCADAVDASEASLLCSAKCYHLASRQASVAKEHNVGFCLWDSFFFFFITLLYIVI